MTYYKFLRLKNGQVISDWDESVWERNEWRDIAIAPVLQAQGFYATERIVDAVPSFGNVLAEVEGPVGSGQRRDRASGHAHCPRLEIQPSGLG